MSFTRVAALAFLVVLHPVFVRAQPFLYVGTTGFTGPASLCASPVVQCPHSVVQLYNAATGTALISHDFGLAGLGGFSRQDIVAAPDGGRVFAVTGGGLIAIDTLTSNLTRVLSDTLGFVEISADGTRVFFGNGKAIRVIDAVSLAVLSSIALPDYVRDLARSPDGAYLYASHNLSGTVSQISTASNAVVGTFTVPDAVALGVGADGSRLYVVTMASQTVTVVDTATGATIATVPTTLAPSTAGRVAVSSTTAYISDVRNSVVFLDVATNTVTRTVKLDSPTAVVLSADSQQLFVAVSTGVVVLDAATGSVVGSLQTTSPAVSLAVLPPVPCLYEVGVSPRVVPLGGGSVSVTIPAPASCNWTLSGRPDWIAADQTTGSGATAIALTVAPGAAPRSARLRIEAQEIQIQQTMPEIHVDLPGGETLTQPAAVTGWAIDRDDSASKAPSPGIDAIHVWAYPSPAGAPIWVGTAAYGIFRPDVNALWGTRYGRSGFSADVRGLAAGAYTLVFYAHSARSGTFSAAVPLNVFVQRPPAQVFVDTPMAGASVRLPFTLAGWAIDASAAGAPGIDVVHVWAYPDSGAAPQFVGSAFYGRARPDVGVALGAGFANSGFDLTVQGLSPGSYRLAVFARSSDTGLFNPASVVPITVAASDPRMYVDLPASNATLQGAFSIDGWAIDLAAGAGSGVDAVHAWVYPSGGGAPRFVGAATPVSRPDVAVAFGAQYGMSGFHLGGATLPAGTYDLVVFARSSVAGAFNNSFVVRIEVQ